MTILSLATPDTGFWRRLGLTALIIGLMLIGLIV
jgi:hypothetical protein